MACGGGDYQYQYLSSHDYKNLHFHDHAKNQQLD